MSIKKDIQELASTAVDVVKELATTGKLLSKDPEARMAICKACECFDNNRCSRAKCTKGCNCFMAVKVRLVNSSCPYEKW
jgi:hypothetical protein